MDWTRAAEGVLIITPVILCGGAGMRLWPLSHGSGPKQFLPLIDGRSTFAMTLERIADREIFDCPLIVAHAEHRFLVSEALRASGTDGEILLEPMRRDSAAAIASAATLIARRDAGALLLVLAADHVIHDSDGFHHTVEIARPAAEADHIVTFGVKPDTPATSYGYIRPGWAGPGLPQIAAVAEFAEKPDAPTAARYVTDGYLWNSGNFMMRASLVLAEFRRYAPAIAAATEAAVSGIVSSPGFSRLPHDRYDAVPAISFDYAIMERTDRAMVVKAGFDWLDIGNWESLGKIAGSDDAGNTMIGDVVAQDTRGSYVLAGKGQIALLGVDDLVRLHRKRKGKKLSNEDWASPSDADANIAKMKDGTTHLAYKPEHAVDLDSGVIVAAAIHSAYQGDTTTLPCTLEAAVRIENKLHWQRDASMNEDRRRVRAGARALASLRNPVLSMLSKTGVSVPRQLLGKIFSLIDDPRPKVAQARAEIIDGEVKAT